MNTKLYQIIITVKEKNGEYKTYVEGQGTIYDFERIYGEITDEIVHILIDEV